jgi:hypothetical protein
LDLSDRGYFFRFIVVDFPVIVVLEAVCFQEFMKLFEAMTDSLIRLLLKFGSAPGMTLFLDE